MFEVFQAQVKPKKLKADEVSITKTNMLLSEQLAARHFVGVRWIVLLFNPEERIIGIRPTEEGEKGYKLSCRGFSSKSFCDHFGIHERGRFPTRVENGILVIQL